MGESKTFELNDTYRLVEREIASLREFKSPLCDERVKAIIITKLEEVQLWALKLIKE